MCARGNPLVGGEKTPKKNGKIRSETESLRQLGILMLKIHGFGFVGIVFAFILFLTDNVGFIRVAPENAVRKWAFFSVFVHVSPEKC